MSIISKRTWVCMWLLTIASASWAYDTVITTGASDAFSTSEFNQVIALGGSIMFEAGSWNIDLDNADDEALADVTIIGSNTVDAGDPDRRGAYGFFQPINPGNHGAGLSGVQVNSITVSKP